MTTEDDVRRIALALPFTTEKPSYGHPMVLVKLSTVEEVELTELITESFRLRAPKKVVQAFDSGAS